MTASLVVQTSFLGDMVLTTPLIAYAAARGPVDVLCTPAAAALLANNPSVRTTRVYDKRGADRGVRAFRELASSLRERRYDTAYLAQGSARSGAVALAARIPERVGFASSAGRLFYTVRIPPIEGMHHAARLLALGTRDPLAAVPADVLRPHLYPGSAERDSVNSIVGIEVEGERLVALAPGSVWATKRWPYFREFARQLSQQPERTRMVIIGGAADGALAAEIVDATDGFAIDVTGKLSLLASAELIRRAAVLVTNDSAPLHLASAMNTPTVAVFGPTIPEFGFGPLASRAAVIGETSLACRPCDKHGPQRCPLGHWRCMREIAPERVAAALRELLVQPS